MNKANGSLKAIYMRPGQTQTGMKFLHPFLGETRIKYLVLGFRTK